MITAFTIAAPVMRRTATARLPTKFGDFKIITYHVSGKERPYYALVMGAIKDAASVLTRVHSACATGDMFRSIKCDCGDQLDLAQTMIAAEGRGIIVYATDQEGRGTGEEDKIKAYAEQDKGLDTIDANFAIGHAADERDYRIAAGVLADLAPRSIRLLTNNPDKLESLRLYGVDVTEAVPLPVPPTLENIAYLRTKLHRCGHTLDPNLLQEVA